MGVATVSVLLDAEVSRISDQALVDVIQKYRITPRLEERAWAYAPNTSFPCWVVLEHTDSNTGVCFSEHGFGPKAPWGLLWLVGVRQDMGDDSGWFQSLEAAVRDSAAWNPPEPRPNNSLERTRER